MHNLYLHAKVWYSLKRAQTWFLQNKQNKAKKGLGIGMLCIRLQVHTCTKQSNWCYIIHYRAPRVSVVCLERVVNGYNNKADAEPLADAESALFTKYISADLFR